MFVCGYSSKGENRGIGLSRVKELANKYEANIKVSNFWYDEENWINFTVEIVK
jgi:two-component system sensor histidine kinase AgrC